MDPIFQVAYGIALCIIHYIRASFPAVKVKYFCSHTFTEKNLIYDPRNPSQILRIFLLTLEIYINHLLFHNHFSYPQNMVITQSLSNLPPATNDSVNNLQIYVTLNSLEKQCWKALLAVRVAVYHGLVAFFKSSAT